MLTSDAVKRQASALGFDLCGIAPAAAHPELRFLDEWLSRGYGAGMAYLAESADRRRDVRSVLPTARSVIVTATLYNTDQPYSVECRDPGQAHVARYAWGDDYHDIIGGRLQALLAWMRSVASEPFEGLAYVDTGPVQERVYARHAGVGWIGKNTCVINQGVGSWLLLGEIVCSIPLVPDAPALDQCGTCSLCLEACPTGALVAPGVLDSSRCISYLTIEHRGGFPEATAAAIGAHVYGCDICQEVCPWNAAVPVSLDPAWQARPSWSAPQVADLVARSDDELRIAVRGSAMKRAKIAGLRRNIDAAAHNAGLSVESSRDARVG